MKLKQYPCNQCKIKYTIQPLLITKVNKFVVTSSGEKRCFYESSLSQ